MTQTRRIRVLHLVPKMDRAGIETWLMHVLRRVDRARFQFDFLATDAGEGVFDAEIRELGGNVFSAGFKPHRKPAAWARFFGRFVTEHARYDVLHAHLDLVSGWALHCARRSGIPIRIAHQHNDITFARSAGWNPWRIAKFAYWRHLLRTAPTGGFGCSARACVCAFGAAWRDDPRWSVLHYGIDPGPFRALLEAGRNRRAVGSASGGAPREELGLGPADIVLGHVGRLERQKNHAFLLRVAKEVFDAEPRARLLLIGEGSLRSAVEEQAKTLRIADRVVFAGVRGDIPALMAEVMDVFVLPSLFEGLGIVRVESQAAGLPAVCTATLPDEADVVPDLSRRCALHDPPDVWGRCILDLLRRRDLPSPRAALEAVERSSMNIAISAERLMEYYREEVARFEGR